MRISYDPRSGKPLPKHVVSRVIPSCQKFADLSGRCIGHPWSREIVRRIRDRRAFPSSRGCGPRDGRHGLSMCLDQHARRARVPHGVPGRNSLAAHPQVESGRLPQAARKLSESETVARGSWVESAFVMQPTSEPVPKPPPLRSHAWLRESIPLAELYRSHGGKPLNQPNLQSRKSSPI